MKCNRIKATGLVWASVWVWAGCAWGQTVFRVVPVNAPGGASSQARAINASGRVAGVGARADASLRAVVWADAGLTVVDPRAPDQQSHATAINDSGQVVLISYSMGDLVPHGLLWSSGVVTDLGDLLPRGLNASGGQVVGSTTRFVPGFGWQERPAMWTDGLVVELATLGGNFGSASAIDGLGRVVGWSFTTNDARRRGTLWSGGTARDLGTLGGPGSMAYAISATGWVAGHAQTASGLMHAARLSVPTSGVPTLWQDLGTLPGAQTSYAFGVNSAGQVVGTSGARAVWWHDGLITDLNTLLPARSGWMLEQAYAINDRGQIVGTGLERGMPRGFVLSPMCAMDFNADGFLNLDDLGDFITDFYTVPALPGGLQSAAPTFAGSDVGFGLPCPSAPDAPAPYAPDAYRVNGYRVGYSPDGSNACPLAADQPFPNLDNLSDYITAYYAAANSGGC